MARGVINPQTSGRVAASADITWVPADGTNKHSFKNTDEKCLLVIRNAHTATHVVAIKRPATVDGVTLGDLSVTVPANGGQMVLGPFAKSLYNQADAGNSLTSAVLIDPPATPTALFFALIKPGGA